MSYLRFDKTQMTNLQDSLYKELLITNRWGAYCSTTLVGCNIRKYHGLLVVPVPELDDENHVLLSSLDETVVQHGAEFNLGLHKFHGENYSPKGHKYIRSFDWGKMPTWVYRIGGVELQKEMAFDTKSHRLFIRYTLLDAHSATTLRLRPYLAFRSVREWTHENPVADSSVRTVPFGVAMRLYDGYPELVMQLSKQTKFVHQPDWYRGFEYPKEQERGYMETEDLLVPGYFEMPIQKGETIVFSASLKAGKPKSLPTEMEEIVQSFLPRDTFYHCLVRSASQFMVQDGEETYLLAGYPWFKCRARDMFVSMPGMTLSIGDVALYERYMATAEKALRSLFVGKPSEVKVYEMDQPDTVLWAIWCLQQYAKAVGRGQCYEKYGALLRDCFQYLAENRHPNLFLHENGLLYASEGQKRPITWMNATDGGRPITPRSGYIVEFNALWYNAQCFVEQMLSENPSTENQRILKRLHEASQRTAASFKEVFLNEHGYLLDYVDGQMQDWSVRPNQLLAIALDFSPLDRTERKRVLDICTKELVTPKGIRSLSPKSGGYNPRYIGKQKERDYAYHQGTAWPWLTGFYLEAYLRVYKMSAAAYIERQLIGFEEELFYHCLGTIPELFDGNPRFSGRGAISFAMNVSGILRAIRLLEQFTKES